MEKSYLIYHAVPDADGSVDWRSVPRMALDNVLWTGDCGIRAYAQLCFDNDRLYVHMSAQETDIRAVNTGVMSPVHEDSCLEFFFKTLQSENYFNFEINPNGCLCVQYGTDRCDRTYLVMKDPERYFDIRTALTPDGWEVFYSIPLVFIRRFCPGFEFRDTIYANLYKCGDLTAFEHYLSWAPVSSAAPDFHRTGDFAPVRFADSGDAPAPSAG